MNTVHSKNEILIVDDQPENLTLLRRILANQGYHVRPALSGEIALTAIHNDLPDLILLDIVMPGMDGFEVCRKLKESEKTREVPIIFISALDEIENKMQAFSQGGVDYISKPFHALEVLARVNTHLTLSSLVNRLAEKNKALQKTIEEVNQLRGMLPICSNCKSIRDDKGYWNILESYIVKHSEATFSHSLCPDCAKKMYGDEDWFKSNQKPK